MNVAAGFDNPLVWCILVLAAATFTSIFGLLLEKHKAQNWLASCQRTLPALRTLVGILPLLGLLGTIVGLLETFEQMSIDHGFDPTLLVSGGIADALFTTQIGLLMVVPGWVLLTLLQAQMNTVQEDASS